MVKVFNSSKLTKAELRMCVCNIAKKVGVKKVVFSDKGIYVKGTYNPKTRILFIDTKQTKCEMLYTFFHELGHHFAVLKNKWKKYHFCLVKKMDVERIFYIENKIDQIGKTLWYKYVNTKQWGKYKYSYPKNQKNYIIKHFISKQ